jgi:hypothetical protein
VTGRSNIMRMGVSSIRMHHKIMHMCARGAKEKLRWMMYRGNDGSAALRDGSESLLQSDDSLSIMASR